MIIKFFPSTTLIIIIIISCHKHSTASNSMKQVIQFYTSHVLHQFMKGLHDGSLSQVRNIRSGIRGNHRFLYEGCFFFFSAFPV